MSRPSQETATRLQALHHELEQCVRELIDGREGRATPVVVWVQRARAVLREMDAAREESTDV